MGYDASLYVMKRKVIDREIKAFPDVPFDILFGNRLFSWVHPEEYEIPEDEVGRYIFDTNKYTINHLDCVEDKYENTIIVEHEMFEKLYDEIESKLRHNSLIVMANCNEEQLGELLDLVQLYKVLVDMEIDWENEVLVYSCG